MTEAPMPDNLWPVGSWLSAALDDPNVCAAMKADIRDWFDNGGSVRTPAGEGGAVAGWANDGALDLLKSGFTHTIYLFGEQSEFAVAPLFTRPQASLTAGEVADAVAAVEKAVEVLAIVAKERRKVGPIATHALSAVHRIAAVQTLLARLSPESAGEGGS